MCPKVRNEWYGVMTAGKALGVVLEVGGVIVEDVAWLQKNDVAYINVAELELVNKGIYFTLK